MTDAFRARLSGLGQSVGALSDALLQHAIDLTVYVALAAILGLIWFVRLAHGEVKG